MSMTPQDVIDSTFAPLEATPISFHKVYKEVILNLAELGLFNISTEMFEALDCDETEYYPATLDEYTGILHMKIIVKPIKQPEYIELKFAPAKFIKEA